MRAFRYTQHIDRTREEVFSFMMDFSTAPRWRNMVTRLEVVGGGPVRQGSILLLTMDVLGKTIQVESEVWCYQPPHRIGQRNTRSGVTGVFEYILEPDRTVSNRHLHMRYSPAWPDVVHPSLAATFPQVSVQRPACGIEPGNRDVHQQLRAEKQSANPSTLGSLSQNKTGRPECNWTARSVLEKTFCYLPSGTYYPIII